MSTEHNAISKKEERRRIEAVYWAGVLVWAGVVFGADQLGYVPQIGEAGPWSWVFLGAGLYSLLGSLYRLSSPNYSNPPMSDYIWGAVFLIIGLGGFTTLKITWPLVLVVVGVILLARVVIGRE